MLEAIKLQCVRGERRLFHRLSFQVKAGECLSVQGENGSGKTSLLRMLVGLTPPADGTVYWNDRSLEQWGNEYGRELLYCGHASGLKEELSATENLYFGSKLANVSFDSAAIQQALHQAGLRGREHLPVRVLSQGQKRRVSLARLLLQKRILWVLDEPLAALDAHATQWVIKVIDRHLSDGGVAVLTTHHDLALTAPLQVIRLDK